MKQIFLIAMLVLSFKVSGFVNDRFREAEKLYEKEEYAKSRVLFQAVEKESISGMTIQERIDLCVYLSKCFTYLGEDDRALDYLLKAQQLNTTASSELGKRYYTPFAEFFLRIEYYDLSIAFYNKLTQSSAGDFDKFLAFGRMGAMYLWMEQPGKAHECFIWQLNCAQKMESPYHCLSARNNSAMALMQMGKNDEAKTILLEVSKKILLYEKKGGFTNSIQSNLAELYCNEKAYNIAVPLLKEVIANKRAFQQETFEEEVLLIASYDQLGETEQLKQLLAQLSYRYASMTTAHKTRFVFLLLFYSERGISIAMKPSRGMYDELIATAEAEKIARNNKNSRLLSSYLQRIGQLKLSLEKKNQQNLARSLRLTKLENTTYAFMSLCLVSVIVVLFLFYKRRSGMIRKEQEMKEDLQELEKDRLLLQNRLQQQNLVELSLEFDHKMTQNKSIIALLNQLKEVRHDEMKEKIRGVILELKQLESEQAVTSRLSKESRMELRLLKARMKERHTGLSKTELKLCTLILLNFSNKQVAASLNVAENTVKMYKNRLGKKVGLENASQLPEYLHTIALTREQI